eukprot:149284_1
MALVEFQAMKKNQCHVLSKAKLDLLIPESTKIIIYLCNLIINDNIKMNMDNNKIIQMISDFYMINDGNGTLQPSIQISKITYNSVVIYIILNQEDKDCICHKLEYVAGYYDYKDDEKLEWISNNI